MIRLPGRRLRYALLIAGSAAALLLAAPAIPASAAPVADLNCTMTVTTDIHPGTTPRLHHQSFTSHGQTGTATCTGTVNGQPVTGPGTFLTNGHVVSNCMQSHGTANFVLKVPTASGTQTVAGHYTISFTGGAITNTGDLTGSSVATHLVGDCVNTPLTQTTEVLTEHVT
jgi:hypothetical protein